MTYVQVELHWSMDQNNNVQKCVERKEGDILPDGRKGLILCQGIGKK